MKDRPRLPPTSESIARFKKLLENPNLTPEQRVKLEQGLRDLERIKIARDEDAARKAAAEGEAAAKPAMTPDQLRAVFDEAASSGMHIHKRQLAHRHMVALVDTFAGWAMDARLDPERSAQFVGYAEAFQKLADEAGEDWDPGEPERMTLMGALGRWVLDEPVPR